jgi:hypothetical protein
MLGIVKPDYAYLEKALSEPLDIEREIWRASRYKFVTDGRMVVPVHRDPYRMSYLTETKTEVIYSNPTVGTAKNTFTTEALAVLNDQAGMGPAPVIPPWFWLPGQARGRVFKLLVRGIFSSTATPTYQFISRLSPVGGDDITGPIIGEMAAGLAVGSGIANQLWQFDLDVQVTIEGKAGANTTLRGLGMVMSPGGFATPFAAALFGGAATPGTVATADISKSQFPSLNVICSASSASNSVQALQMLLFGLN